ncbi:hypothetical protein INT47_006751 [Mucor saturninus]|uniref:GRIP domain-containing protein n=1 Tax=Mucor saturninus TaxID=64648 RepID=A0A8H7V2S0_9FUNG|nr:hypothetical protein INT47_006751 [Mucor saturninus]
MVKSQLSNNKKILQAQVSRLNNEIEELRLEREESKKNVLHFMQEADSTRQELKKAQQLIDEFSACPSSPPPSEDGDHLPERPKLSLLLSRLSVLDETSIDRLFQWLDVPLDKTMAQLEATKEQNTQMAEELDQLRVEYQVTKSTLKVENERAEIIEKRWKESESALEQAESTIQALHRDLDYFRQQQQQQQECNSHKPMDSSLSDILCTLENKHREVGEQLILANANLKETTAELLGWQEKHGLLFEQYTQMKNKQCTELETIKIREQHLRTANKTLREEIRRVNKVQEEIINIEYLRNVIIKFLERRNTRAQLVPILSTLLQCSHDEQTRLSKLIK